MRAVVVVGVALEGLVEGGDGRVCEEGLRDWVGGGGEWGVRVGEGRVGVR